MTNNSTESNKNSDSAFNQNMTTDTPRTDAEIFEIQDCNGQLRKVITIQYAKQLERELAVSLENQVKTQAEAERLRSTMRSFILVSPIEFERMEKIEAEVERLKKALESL